MGDRSVARTAVALPQDRWRSPSHLPRTGSACATSAPGPARPVPHRRQDWRVPPYEAREARLEQRAGQPGGLVEERLQRLAEPVLT